MTKEFRYRFLRFKFLELEEGGDLLLQTQKLFALLMGSHRPAIDQKEFKLALPSPFNQSTSEHDTSSFGWRFLDQLKYLFKKNSIKVILTNSVFKFNACLENNRILFLSSLPVRRRP